MKAWRLKMEPWRFHRPRVVDPDPEPDPDPYWIRTVKSGNFVTEHNFVTTA
jgi:hypothetical protein